MNYIITSDKSILESWQALVDEKLGYPEPLDSLQNVGLGPWADKELGRAMHYAEILTHQDGKIFALPFSDAVELPEGVTVSELPEDWYPKREEETSQLKAVNDE